MELETAKPSRDSARNAAPEAGRGRRALRAAGRAAHSVLDALGFPLGLFFAVPIIGRFLREAWSVLLEVFHRLIGLFDLAACALGLDWPKKLRICVIILQDRHGFPVGDLAGINAEIEKTRRVLKAAANIEVSVGRIRVLDKPAPARNLDVTCDGWAWADDLGTPGSYFEFAANTTCPGTIANRLTGWAAPVIVFVVRSVDSRESSGCSLNVLSDFVLIEGEDHRCLAHELGHACGLWHHRSAENIMSPTCGGTKLKKWQRCVVRNSRHISYL